MTKYLYVNNTNTDLAEYHAVIMVAIANGGTFPGDFGDLFVLTKTPEGSAAEYALDFA